MNFEPGTTFPHEFTAMGKKICCTIKHVCARDAHKAIFTREKIIAAGHTAKNPELYKELMEAVLIGLVSFTVNGGEPVEAKDIDLHAEVNDLYTILNRVIYGPEVTAEEKKPSE